MRATLRKYQESCVQHILDKQAVGLFLGMGAGKTLICLRALEEINPSPERPALIICPASVQRAVWEAEIEKWDFKLPTTILEGMTHNERINELWSHRTKVFVISRDLVNWLFNEVPLKKWRAIIVDESTSFKSPSAQRTKTLAKHIHNAPYRVILSGTPTSNSMIDLFSQVYLLDKGQRLGKSSTSFKNAFFTVALTINNIPIKWDIRAGAKERILALISDICVSMRTEDLVELPEVSYNDILLPMSEALEKRYKTFVRTKVLPQNDEQSNVYAQTAAALTQKLCQFANGQIYENDSEDCVEVHNLKIKWLEEFVETSTQKILVFYQFISDRDLVLKTFGKDAIHLKTAEDIDKWRKGEATVAVAHPQSMGYGLNLMDISNVIVWYGLTWSAEQYEQANARIVRAGQVFKCQVYHLMLDNSIDAKILKVLKTKSDLKEEVLKYLKMFK